MTIEVVFSFGQSGTSRIFQVNSLPVFDRESRVLSIKEQDGDIVTAEFRDWTYWRKVND